MRENDFVKNFYNFYQEKFEFVSYNPYSRTQADVSFIRDEGKERCCYVLESKVYNRNNSANYPKQLMTEILM